MKKLTPFALVLLLAACGPEGRDVEQKVDKVLQKVEDKTEVLADSAKEKYKDVRDHLDTALDADRNDTTE
ncbi:hypothetical protein SAMN05444008_102265 [Cnuella takakiae]|uniref:Lipoprotein n=1 Tax=Cnuella takakiae TaxID=1302690 RepID=A0A1M4VH36_9BACT|nr:hypothetical protein [Cnuella takakiae]OLY92597.1 hypothetical protein BUE76_12385 [Cnuella takakiae]SHE68309.1 hypothetical protein SAMN05444008_102265 [Cnuella takakiae]